MANFMVKVRGEAKGPYSAAQLQTQIRRKRLSRQHQVSSDGGVSWTRAGELDELFPTQTRKQPAFVAEPELISSDENIETSSAAADTGWTYSVLGQEMGPVPESEIRMLIASGGIEASTLLWREGMTDWVEVQHIPAFAMAVRSRHGGSRSEGVPSQQSPPDEKTLHWPSLAALVIALISLTLTIPGCTLALAGSGALSNSTFSRSATASGLLFVALWMLPGLLFAVTGVLVGHAAYRLSNNAPGRFEGTIYSVVGLVLGYVLLFVMVCVGIVCLVSIAKS